MNGRGRGEQEREEGVIGAGRARARASSHDSSSLAASPTLPPVPLSPTSSCFLPLILLLISPHSPHTVPVVSIPLSAQGPRCLQSTPYSPHMTPHSPTFHHPKSSTAPHVILRLPTTRLSSSSSLLSLSPFRCRNRHLKHNKTG